MTIKISARTIRKAYEDAQWRKQGAITARQREQHRQYWAASKAAAEAEAKAKKEQQS